MDDVNFKSLQNLHESLLQKQQGLTEENQQSFANEVREYIERTKQAGSHIPSTRERDQLRAILRYWGNYIYSVDKTFPDTELAPSTVKEGNTIAFIVFIVLVLVGGVQTFRYAFNQSSQATNTPIDSPLPSTPLTTKVPVTSPAVVASSTSVFIGSDVVFTSPENGESVLPRVVFTGTYTNLDAGSTIHVLLIRGDNRLYPLQDSFAVPADATTDEWSIGDGAGGVALYRGQEELEQEENLIAIPVACFDSSCRGILANAVQNGLSVKELPSQLTFTLYRDSSRPLFRNAYQQVTGPRIVYSYFDGTSYDLYTASLDGKSKVQITFTPDIDEMFPSLSPDGKKMVFVKRFHTGAGAGDFSYVVAVWDGIKEIEVNGRTPSLIESTQWSFQDSISFVIGDTTKTPTAYQLFVYNLSTSEGKDISAEFVRRDNYRYSSWLPDRNALIFNVGIPVSGSSGFALMDLDTMASPDVFFDSQQEDIEPRIHLEDDKYLLTYIVNNDPSNLHDIYMVLMDRNGRLPHNETPVRLIESTGQFIESPIAYPEENALYYTKYGSIYRAEYQIVDGVISIKITPNVRSSGIVIIPAETTGERVEQIYFDIHNMDMFFPIDQTSATPAP